LIGNKVETEPVLDAERRNLANMIEPPVCGGYAAFLWSPYVIGQTIIFLPCDFYVLSFYLLFLFLA